uniref:Uncharacterized protein n=1 Tax=Anguilla anguilla TaxID=7936 RepID=A0A0E9PQS5_ANGAN
MRRRPYFALQDFKRQIRVYCRVMFGSRLSIQWKIVCGLLREFQ